MDRTDAQRELRRAVAELAQCPIEHIESVWAELSADERARLQPLLAEASGLIGREPAATALLTGTRDAIVSPGSGHPIVETTDEAMTVLKAAHLAQTLPEPLAIRLLASITGAMRREVLDALPDTQRESFVTAPESISLTVRAKAAWIAACMAHVVDVPLLEVSEVSEAMSRRQRIFGHLRRWAGGRR
ncbi:hypothetical protein PTKU46_74900 [Paraburkholderia terrae]|uniref:hypothetical protein n=1 Tax=Paraburkholderia terrae TaxID=311230 RepID=UPI0030E3289F